MGNIFTAATSLFGIFGGPTFGVYVCGMFFPWTNNLGVSAGLLTSVIFMAFIGIGQTVYNTDLKLPIQWKSLETTCPAYTNNTEWSGFRELDWKSMEWNDLTQTFSISPLWYPCYGIISSVILGLLFSIIFHRKSKVVPMESRLFIPVALALWKKICPSQLTGFVKFTEQELADNPQLSNGTLVDSPTSNGTIKPSQNGTSNHAFEGLDYVPSLPRIKIASEKDKSMYQ